MTPSQSAEIPAVPGRPNVVILMSDQHSFRAMGCYGNREVHTPHLDRLAVAGVRFDAAYTPSPVCIPGRHAIATGRYAHTVRTIAYPFLDGSAQERAAARRAPAALSVRERTHAHHFRDAGYVTGYIGKLHPIGPHTYGFDYYVDFGHYADFLGPRQATFARAMRAVDQGCGVPWVDTLHRDRRGPWAQVPFPTAEPEGFEDEADHPEQFFAREAVRFLHAYRDEPFCLVVSFLRPHAPWAAAPRYTALYDPEQLTLPPEPAVPAADDPRLPSVLRAAGQHRWQPHETWPFPPPGHPDRPAARRRWQAAYYACVSQMDAAAGRVLDTLGELGLASRTLVMYTSDHGEMAGEHGLHQKFVFYEGSARVPLLIRCPWMAPPGTACRTPLDLADVVPTCIDVCNLPAPDPAGDHALEGTSLVTLLRHPERPAPHGKGFAFSEMAYGPEPAYMLRQDNWKYVHYTGTNERQLFDLAADPHEGHDLAGTPDAATVEDTLRHRLLEWLPAHVPR